MTARMVPAIVCDHPECPGRRWAASDRAIPPDEFRAALHRWGWRRVNGDDICPDHPEPDEEEAL